MAITNEMLVFNEEQRLAKEGLIKYTAMVTATDPLGGEISYMDTERIHTYQAWQDLGYQVRKGEKAITKLTIWKHVDGGETEGGRMFRKTSAFFSASQVDKKCPGASRKAPRQTTSLGET